MGSGACPQPACGTPQYWVSGMTQVDLLATFSPAIRRRGALLVACLALFLPGCVVSEPPRPEPPVQEAMVQGTHTPSTRTPIPTILPAEQLLDAGLQWRECDVTGFDWREGEACLGYSLSALADSGRTVGTRTDVGELVLQVDGDVYETRTLGSDLLARASLHKNGRRVRTIFDGTPFHSPNISLRLIDGKVA